MANLIQIRRLIADIINQQHGRTNVHDAYEKLGIELDDLDILAPHNLFKEFSEFLDKLNENDLNKLAIKVVEVYPSASARGMLKALVHENHITLVTRKNLIDELFLLGNLEGKLGLVDFLKRIWDLDAMPSTDYRFNTASGDVWQHMVNNNDWDMHYLLFTYLGLDGDEDNVFFRFCEEVVHPLIRVDEDNQNSYIRAINKHLEKDGYKLQLSETISGHKIYKALLIRTSGVEQKVKNLIFASTGPKPEIVISDAIHNDITIVKNAEYCLVYDLPIDVAGLTTKNLIDWWTNRHTGLHSQKLYSRLLSSLPQNSPPEKLLFETYYGLREKLTDEKLPALLPQVYLHYDPYTLKQLDHKKRLPRQRMDFLILFSNYERVVIEVDGKQHYSDGERADTKKYAEMVAADRELRLLGYEVYRFGSYELLQKNGKEVLENFFATLLKKYGVIV